MNLESKFKFASVVKTLRGDMSKSAFARTLGVSHTAISNWEDAQHIPDSKTLSKIAHKAGYTLDEFISYLEDKKIYKPSMVDEMLSQVKSMPPKELALLGRAVSDRLYAIAESVG